MIERATHTFFANRKLAISEIIEPSKPSMLDLEIQRKIDAIELAKQLQNVAEAARRCGVSRQIIYRNQEILNKQGPQAFKRTFKKDHYHKNRTPQNIEAKVIKKSTFRTSFGVASIQLRATTC